MNKRVFFRVLAGLGIGAFGGTAARAATGQTVDWKIVADTIAAHRSKLSETIPALTDGSSHWLFKDKVRAHAYYSSCLTLHALEDAIRQGLSPPSS